MVRLTLWLQAEFSYPSFNGLEVPTDENVLLVDRPGGVIFKCEAQGPGKASCEPDTATGSIGARPKP